MSDFLYKKFVKLNFQTERYVDDEIKDIGNSQKMLGILMRGTDYVTTKPAGHPIQPETQELFVKANELILENQCSAVYVATDGKKLFLQTADCFGSKYG